MLRNHRSGCRYAIILCVFMQAVCMISWHCSISCTWMEHLYLSYEWSNLLAIDKWCGSNLGTTIWCVICLHCLNNKTRNVYRKNIFMTFIS
jgi:hypothetical protein